MRLYAELIDRDQLAAKVAKVGLPEEAGAAFLALYDDAVRRARGTRHNYQQTNRLSRIRPDGTLEYEEVCSYRPTSRTVDLHAPINLPAAEAKQLRKGDSLRFVTHGDEARVVEVKRDGKVIQVRSDPMTLSPLSPR